jgi:hypothetical protein
MTRHSLAGRSKKRSGSIGTTAGVAVVASLTLLGCGGGKANDGGSPPPATSGLGAFRSGLYAFATPTTSCGLCHASAQVPLFANPDVQAAYAAAKPLVDFANPTNSLFIVYAGNNHCGVAAVCGPGAGSAAIVQQDLVQWASAELPPGSGGSPAPAQAFLTASMPIPPIAMLPTLLSGKTAPLRFALSGLVPAVPALASAVLELEVVAPNATEYRFSNPKIGGGTVAVQLTGLHVLVKPSSVAGPGSEDANQGDTWDDIAVSIPASTLPSPLPTGPLALTPLDTRAIAVGAYTSSGDLNDTITVGFDALQ